MNRAAYMMLFINSLSSEREVSVVVLPSSMTDLSIRRLHFD